RSVAMARVRVGLVGCGFAAELHMEGYRRVFGIEAEVSAVAARGDHVRDFAAKHRIGGGLRAVHSLLADSPVRGCGLCPPPARHGAMITAAVRAGKHVICEKPFCGYFGRSGDSAPIGTVAKSLMYERVLAEMDEIGAAIAASGKLFMYAEDWVYAPAVAKT